MKLRDIYRLAHREYAAYKTRSVATIITVGALFGLLLGILFVMQGLENVTLRYAGEATDGWIYLANSYEDRGVDDSFIRQRDVFHLQAAEFSDPYTGKQCDEYASGLPVQVHVDALNQSLLLILRQRDHLFYA